MATMTAAGWRIVDRALRRSEREKRPAYACPLPWNGASAQAALERLQRDGFVSSEPSPVVTPGGWAEWARRAWGIDPPARTGDTEG